MENKDIQSRFFANATCAFTRVPIEGGDKILFVGVDPTYVFNTSDLLSNLDAYESEGRWWDSMKYASDHRNFRPHTPHPLRFAVVGEYDSFQGVRDFLPEERLDGGRNYWEYQFMIHKEVAELFLGKKIDQETVDFSDVHKLVEVCHELRIELREHSPLGKDFADSDDLVLQLKNISIAKTILERKLNRLSGKNSNGAINDEQA